MIKGLTKWFKKVGHGVSDATQDLLVLLLLVWLVVRCRATGTLGRAAPGTSSPPSGVATVAPQAFPARECPQGMLKDINLHSTEVTHKCLYYTHCCRHTQRHENTVNEWNKSASSCNNLQPKQRSNVLCQLHDCKFIESCLCRHFPRFVIALVGTDSKGVGGEEDMPFKAALRLSTRHL